MKSRILIAAMIGAAMSSYLPMVKRGTRKDVDWTGRREEKNAVALAKADAKRERKRSLISEYRTRRGQRGRTSGEENENLEMDAGGN